MLRYTINGRHFRIARIDSTRGRQRWKMEAFHLPLPYSFFANLAIKAKKQTKMAKIRNNRWRCHYVIR